MNCKKCGYVLTQEDQFCKNCGEAVNSQINNVDVQPSVESPNTYQQNQTPEQIVSSNPVSFETPNILPTGFESAPEQNFESQNNAPTGFENPNNVQPSYDSMNNSQPSYNNVNTNPQPNYNNMNNNYPNSYENNQQSWNSVPTTNNKPMNNANPNSKNIAIIAAVVVVLIAVAAVIGIVINDKDDNNKSSNDVATSQNNESSYKVKYNGFTFNISDNLQYQEVDGDLYIANAEETWLAEIQIVEASFSKLQSNKNQMQANFKKEGLTASAPKDKTISGINYITLEVSGGGQNAIAAYAKANSMYVFALTLISVDNDYDYKILENITPIIKSAKYDGNSKNNLKTKVDIKEVIKTIK